MSAVAILAALFTGFVGVTVGIWIAEVVFVVFMVVRFERENR